MSDRSLPILSFILTNYKNFNARATRDALIAYRRHLAGGGKMFWAMAGAMSSAQLGISLAPAIRAGLVHGLSVTGANLEESMFRLVAHHGYKDFPEYRYFTKAEPAGQSVAPVILRRACLTPSSTAIATIGMLPATTSSTGTFRPKCDRPLAA